MNIHVSCKYVNLVAHESLLCFVYLYEHISIHIHGGRAHVFFIPMLILMKPLIVEYIS